MVKSSNKDPPPAKKKKIRAPCEKGLSFNHDFSYGKRRFRSLDDARVSKNTNGYFKKVESPSRVLNK